MHDARAVMGEPLDEGAGCLRLVGAAVEAADGRFLGRVRRHPCSPCRRHQALVAHAPPPRCRHRRNMGCSAPLSLQPCISASVACHAEDVT